MTEQSTAATTTNAAADATSGTPAPATTATATPAGSTTSPDPSKTTSTAVTGDPAPTGDTPTGEAAATDTPALKAPEKYEFTAPEGMTLEPGITAEFETIARVHDLSNEDAQKFVGLGAKLVEKLASQQQEAHTAQVSKWLDDAKADKEFGGEQFEKSITAARKAVEKFGTSELKGLLEQTGLGNHPEIVRLFHRIGNAIAEDSLVIAASGGGSKRSAASVLFDNPTSQPQR
jgi:hypothetical protein